MNLLETLEITKVLEIQEIMNLLETLDQIENHVSKSKSHSQEWLFYLFSNLSYSLSNFSFVKCV